MMTLSFMSFVAGNVSVLSPCVFPALPFITSTALEKHKLGPLAIASGLLTSFTLIGVSMSMFGSIAGIDKDLVTTFSALLMIVLGMSFFSSSIQSFSNGLFSRFANKANGILSMKNLNGLKGQYLTGLLVGAVWSPCIGPTLGSAMALAGQTHTRAQGALLILIYGLGIIVPFLMMAYVTRHFKMNKILMMNVAMGSKKILGFLLIVFGIFVLTGLDKVFEKVAFTYMPESFLSWLTSF